MFFACGKIYDHVDVLLNERFISKSHASDNDLLYDGCLAIVQSSLEGFRDLKFDIISTMLNTL